MKFTVITCLLAMFFSFIPSLSEAKVKSVARALFKSGREVYAVNGIKSYDENTLRPDQLKQCFLLGKEIDKTEKLILNNSEVKEKDESLSTLENEIKNLNNYLDAKRKSIFNTQSEVDAFNAKVDAYNNLTSLYNKELAVYKDMEALYNIKVNLHNVKVDKFQLSCAGKSYYVEDMTWNII